MARCEFDRVIKVESPRFVRALIGGDRGAYAQDRGSNGALLAEIVPRGDPPRLGGAHACYI